jgi:hypothetical protein
LPLKQNQSRCAHHNWFVLPFSPPRKDRSRKPEVRFYTEKIQCRYFQGCAL